MIEIVPVILSGGSGTRLWPLSRKHYPKQFLPLVSDNSLLQDTVARAKYIVSEADPVIVSNNDHRFIVAEQVKEINVQPGAIILEPCPKNTAPAIALAALMLEDRDTLMLVMPSDHLIINNEALKKAVYASADYALEGQVVTFGIVPDHASTGYGYIKASTALDTDNVSFLVDKFIEKPDGKTAESYLSSGNYFWNSGMFLLRASVYLDLLKQFEPEIWNACQLAVEKSQKDLDFVRIDHESFGCSPSISIDYAIMEKLVDAVVTPIDVGWNDVGSWSSLWEVVDKDDDGNACYGDVYTKKTRNCFVHSENKFIATLGVDNLVIVESDDAILVASRESVQSVKDIVGFLEEQNREEGSVHRKVYRPWGFYDTVDIGARHKVKRIMVKPGQKLSLQMHHQRAEHWVVVQGLARVTKNDETFLLSENQSTYISVGMTHRLENVGRVPLELVEVQSGEYLGEDDIVRYDDHYGRA
ncbi:MAG: mannose-1-phosphate guanylyltransferase/mannose-6-phosphate isomerase [Pseudomonadales bacterium]|nr:mannose-1-phosphate guanylyltransferase/mannose-6-phosphate isomerase [Pseudomonadales bacterium]